MRPRPLKSDLETKTNLQRYNTSAVDSCNTWRESVETAIDLQVNQLLFIQCFLFDEVMVEPTHVAH